MFLFQRLSIIALQRGNAVAFLVTFNAVVVVVFVFAYFNFKLCAGGPKIVTINT